MLERLNNLPPDIVALKAVGKVSKADYDEVFQPILDEARRDGRRLRFLYQFGPSFEGFTPGALWEDAKIGVRSMRLFGACAVVSDIGWLRSFVHVAGSLVPCPVRIFSGVEFDSAVKWLRSVQMRPAERPALSHRLLPESGVAVVEIKGALRTADFDELALTVDAWIQEHGELPGLVIHAHEFPGWKNFTGLLRQLRFVRDQHERIRRVAMVADSKLLSLSPQLAEHFVGAEVKSFGYEELETAIDWAGQEPTGRAVAHSAS